MRAFALAVALFGGAAASHGQGGARAIIGYSAFQAPIAPLWIAEEQGFFGNYGIDPKLVFVRTTSVHIAGLVAGHIDMSYSGGSGVLAVAASGVDLRFLAAFGNRLTHFLVTRPEIQKPRDLYGKRLGVVSIGGTQWITTKQGMEYLKLDEQRDAVQLLAIGDQSVLRSALEAGSIEGAFFNGAMAEELRARGLRVLVDLHEANIPTVSSGVIIRKASLQKNPELAANVLRAMIEGLAFVKSPRHKPMVIRTLMHRLKIGNPAVAEQGYRYLQRDLDINFAPPLEGLRNLQRFMKSYNRRIGEFDVADLVDGSVVKQLSESGFIDKVLRSYGLK
jgi:NitT/TauT family transport system substrate-binding protein